MKNLLILIVLLPLLLNAQHRFNEKCEEGIQRMDTLIMDNNQIFYKVFQVKKLYSKGSTDFYDGTVIIPEKTEKLSDLELKNLMNEIGDIYKVNELMAFKNCKAVRIFYQAIKPSNEQKMFLRENLIGIFKIE